MSYHQDIYGYAFKGSLVMTSCS